MVIRELTSQEAAILGKRKSGFEAFLAERMPVLSDFMERLGMHDPALVLVEAERYLPSLEEWLRDQLIDSSERVWILTRLGYFIGEYLVQRLGGCWLLNDAPDSRTFACYVVGRFQKVENRNAMVDPFAIAEDCIANPPGRSLARLSQVLKARLLRHEVEERQRGHSSLRLGCAVSWLPHLLDLCCVLVPFAVGNEEDS